ncbi:T9SS type A sorting domain-containing protein, partial [Flavobacteriales bacterium]|nr:T9SS type A sorting domain-containing protein [Flavobacteriales bacterium]
ATEENGNCNYPPANFDCEGNLIVVVYGCTDAASCTFDAGANTDDGSCEYLDALGECGGECPGDADGDGVCDNAEIPGCTDGNACNYDEDATDESGNCEYATEGYDCDGNLLNVVEGCTDEASCTYDVTANTDDGSCEYLDALGECGGDCEADTDGDGICDTAEILGCTDPLGCNYDSEATEENGGCEYAEEGFDCDGNPLTNSIAEWAEQAPALTPFPNPSSKGQSTQVLGLSSQGPWTVSIWSSDGKLMGQQLLLAEPHLRGWRIELSAPRQTGLYFIRVTSADHTSVTPRTGRLIVR